MKFCPECGHPLARETSKFCDSCGAPLEYGAAPFPGALPLRQAHEEKSPFMASMCSSFIPGLGQVYNGMTARGIVFFTATLIGFFLLMIPGLIFWIYGIYDAHSMAGKMNRGEIPFMPTSTAHMIIFALVAILIIIVAVVIVVLTILAAVGQAMQQVGTIPGMSPGTLPGFNY